ncbi:nucleoside triphosphate pyrophosphohydrolase [Candidatus Methylacidithermus pantelleriae]|uniref:Nucleoside triphosphate pyrophosphohydrolase n=1 Tax=Candidatus Methylacidithermus pantelleriae TaxID=2744239 RepID=A0A8J2BS13_9BACT|nr:nucleoside triphosphate pyrophosphohydrolase [Candidatus Methylacidithermus pantelleriae]CAF0693916.1 Nucleoside triphosphate pyrophosphohydrolase [Candidatus Methylacidithermus pantelleriae]
MNTLPQDPIQRLEELLRILRGPKGCPWDREQTHQSLKGQLLEECYETVEAIDSGQAEALKEELGDLLLHIAFHAQLAHEANQFDLKEIAEEACQKILRRHPHVFGDQPEPLSSQGVVERWNQIKKAEKKDRSSELDGIPKPLPSLLRAEKLAKRARGAGLSFPEPSWLVNRVRELVQKLQAMSDEDGCTAETVLGELLWTVVCLALCHKLSAEELLRKSLHDFEARFRHKENSLRKEKKTWQELPHEEAYATWFDVEANTHPKDNRPLP